MTTKPKSKRRSARARAVAAPTLPSAPVTWVERREGGKAGRIVVYLPPELVDRLDILAAVVRKRRGKAIAEAIEEWIGRNKHHAATLFK